MDAISSLHNPKIKKALKLWKRNERDATGLFLIEGYRELSRAYLSHVAIETLFICRDFFLGDNEDSLIQQIVKNGARLMHTTAAVFQKLSYRDRPDGLIAIARKLRHSLHSIERKNNPFYVIAESVEKPGNLGTILRSSDAASVNAVIVCDRCTDIHNPNVVRASVGTLFTQPVIETTSEETIDWLKEQNIAIVAATPASELEFTQCDFTSPLAIAVGTEQYGLSRRWLEAADCCVKIPMLGVADSLNVAMATTLLLYEVVRQRRDSLCR